MDGRASLCSSEFQMPSPKIFYPGDQVSRLLGVSDELIEVEYLHAKMYELPTNW